MSAIVGQTSVKQLMTNYLCFKMSIHRQPLYASAIINSWPFNSEKISLRICNWLSLFDCHTIKPIIHAWNCFPNCHNDHHIILLFRRFFLRIIKLHILVVVVEHKLKGISIAKYSVIYDFFFIFNNLLNEICTMYYKGVVSTVRHVFLLYKLSL